MNTSPTAGDLSHWFNAFLGSVPISDEELATFLFGVLGASQGSTLARTHRLAHCGCKRVPKLILSAATTSEVRVLGARSSLMRFSKTGATKKRAMRLSLAILPSPRIETLSCTEVFARLV